METTLENPSPPNRTCDYCGRPISGRLDRKFCDVNCKNNFNSRQRSAFRAGVHPNAGQIIKQIKINYEILLKRQVQKIEKDATTYINKEQLVKDGFDPRFFTSLTTDKWGEIWKCCFDCGFREIEDGNIELAHFPKQAEL
ncbi:MAG: hypothetical protein WC622_02665 [Pedobacter sp.]|jgi:hypothetical protein|uniref:hypothetical protein n=1 Tax=Pedobacter sp. TaxID=1411316 RepID=UPI003565B5BC